MRKAGLFVCIGSLMLAACASGSGGSKVAARPAPATAQVPPPRIQREEGLESVIGRGASSLTRRFGQARIDLAEGDARKLQFISDRCVLDIFLYPLERGSAPVATHVEARRREGGGEVQKAQCIEEVERSARGG